MDLRRPERAHLRSARIAHSSKWHSSTVQPIVSNFSHLIADDIIVINISGYSNLLYLIADDMSHYQRAWAITYFEDV